MTLLTKSHGDSAKLVYQISTPPLAHRSNSESVARHTDNIAQHDLQRDKCSAFSQQLHTPQISPYLG